VLKEIHRGSFTIDSTTDVVDVDLSRAVTQSKCFITFKVRNLNTNNTDMDYYGNYGFGATFLDNDTLRFSRYYETAQQLYIDWFVYEILPTINMTVERGTVTIDANPKDVTLSTSDVTKTFAFVNLYSADFNWDGDPDQQVLYHQTFLNGSTPTLRIRGNYLSVYNTAYWQVITAPECTIQKGVTSLPNTSNQNDVTISEIDLTRTMLLMNYKLLDATIPAPNTQHLKYARLSSSTNLRFYAYVAMACDYAGWYLVTFPKKYGVTVRDQGFNIFGGESADLVFGNSIYIQRLIANLTLHNGCWATVDSSADSYKDVGTTVLLTNIVGGKSDTFSFQRGDQDAAPTNCAIAYQRMEFVWGTGFKLINQTLAKNKLTCGRLT